MNEAYSPFAISDQGNTSVPRHLLHHVYAIAYIIVKCEGPTVLFLFFKSLFLFVDLTMTKVEVRI